MPFAGSANLMAFEVLNDDKSKTMLPIPLEMRSVWRFTLTDKFLDDTIVGQDDAPLGKGGSSVWDTIYLGQTKDEEGRNLLKNGKPLKYNPNTSRTIPSPDHFIVDDIRHCEIGFADVQTTAYSKLITSNTPVYQS